MGSIDAQLDQALMALADPTRRRILLQLADGDATVTALCEPHNLSQPAISKHLKVLEKAGLIVRRKDGRTRPCALAPKGLDAIDRWLGPLREAMERRYQKLDSLLATLEAEASAPPKDTRGRKP